jgi:hypothetical protein
MAGPRPRESAPLLQVCGFERLPFAPFDLIERPEMPGEIKSLHLVAALERHPLVPLPGSQCLLLG